MLEIIVLLSGQICTALNETSGISQMSMGTENKSAERFLRSVLTREAGVGGYSVNTLTEAAFVVTFISSVCFTLPPLMVLGHSSMSRFCAL